MNTIALAASENAKVQWADAKGEVISLSSTGEKAGPLQMNLPVAKAALRLHQLLVDPLPDRLGSSQIHKLEAVATCPDGISVHWSTDETKLAVHLPWKPAVRLGRTVLPAGTPDAVRLGREPKSSEWLSFAKALMNEIRESWKVACALDRCNALPMMTMLDKRSSTQWEWLSLPSAAGLSQRLIAVWLVDRMRFQVSYDGQLATVSIWRDVEDEYASLIVSVGYREVDEKQRYTRDFISLRDSVGTVRVREEPTGQGTLILGDGILRQLP